MELNNYLSLGTGLVKLFGPLIEVVIHDVASGKIIFIEGGLSKRKVGDPSLLGDITKESLDKDLEQPYTRINYDGRLLKSITIPLKAQGKLKAMLCINCDMTPIQELHVLTNSLLNTSAGAQPEILFKNDWQEKIHQFINQMLKEHGWHFQGLTNKSKKEIIRCLYQQGAFKEKNASDYIAKILDMSRATVFNHLRIIKKS